MAGQHEPGADGRGLHVDVVWPVPRVPSVRVGHRAVGRLGVRTSAGGVPRGPLHVLADGAVDGAGTSGVRSRRSQVRAMAHEGRPDRVLSAELMATSPR